MIVNNDDIKLDQRRAGSGRDKPAQVRIDYHSQNLSMSQASRGNDERKGSYNDF